MKYKHSLVTAARGTKKLALLLSILTAITTASPAFADSPSEMLEQGIYSEESKGDLDGAMQLYQQVIAQGKTSQALAAQAQYRLGVCYFKKQKLAEATAAFESVVKDYPDQKDLVALARDYLSGNSALQPAPWVDGEEMRLDLKLAGGLKIGIQSLAISSGETNGEKIWRISSRLSAGVQSFSRVEVDAESFKPIHSRWKHPLLGDADTTYASDHADLKFAGKSDIKTLPLDGPMIDNEETLEWMRRLPLAPGYKVTQKLLASLGSHVIPVTFQVTGPESVTVAAGAYNCYKVDLSIAQTFWYSTDAHHYLVKWEAGGAVAELTSIGKITADKAAVYRDPSFGFSVTAPTGWLFDRGDAQEKGQAVVSLLDPDAMANSVLVVNTLDSLTPEDRKSLRSWADDQSSKGAKVFQNFQGRADGVQDLTVAGQPAVSTVSDYTEREIKQTAYDVYLVDDSHAAHFALRIPTKDFDAFRPKFDAIVDSYKAK